MAGNRVDLEHMELMKKIASDRLETELHYLDDLFDRPIPDPFEKDYAKSAQKRAGDIRAEMGLVNDLCKWAAGAVHPASSNTAEEKKLANDLVKATREKMAKALSGD